MTFPITEPVIIFALAMVIFFLTPLLMQKIRIPGIIGPILAGVIVGPNGFHLLERDQTIELLGAVGLLFIIFIAGLELDIDGFKKYRKRSLVFGSISFFIPFILGMSITLLLDFSMSAAILVGSILGSHTLLAYPIVSRLGIAKNKAVTTAVGGTLLTDSFAMFILAIIAGITTGQVNAQFWIQLIVSTIIFVFIMLKVVPLLSKWFFRHFGTEGVTNFTFVMVILFGAGFLAILAGLQPIIGAFLAGLALNRYVLKHSALMNRIRFVGNGLFIPFFLLSVGMLMDVKILFTDPEVWMLTGAIVVAVMVGKALAPIIVSKLYHYDKTERNIMIGLTVPQAAGTLAATLVGYDIGLLDQAFVNAVIIKILITCIAGPYLVEKFARRQALTEENIPQSQGNAPERIMIPIANPNTMESLIDVANSIKREHTNDQPIYPLSVVREEAEGTKEQVAQAERMLGRAHLYAAGAEIPIRILTKVDKDIIHGISRAIIEERINTVVIGWNAQRNQNTRIGPILDRLVDETNLSVLITRVDIPLETVKRIVLILPFGIDHKPGFYEAIERMKILTSRLNANLMVVVVKGMQEHYEAYFKKIRPNPDTVFYRVENWHELRSQHTDKLLKDDIVILLSARKGTIGWHPQLDKMPEYLAQIHPEGFIIYYPTEEKEVDLRGSKGLDVPKEVLMASDYDKE
ncbi:cation:proton antiporter [Gracilibacillus alcaliphilus]|uniref:cation:proton antiporter n=1 Tax=Gracilibacillus alcaliphilus TaxID=1401441 RepID=UPI001957C727|nr:cation:proton antiporter [Gracilibacillus alcaliphilus]MBM7677006.1 Kef-type K+ transport system membrane component KefB [Gracilibacillus alcaliphilus]